MVEIKRDNIYNVKKVLDDVLQHLINDDLHKSEPSTYQYIQGLRDMYKTIYRDIGGVNDDENLVVFNIPLQIMESSDLPPYSLQKYWDVLHEKIIKSINIYPLYNGGIDGETMCYKFLLTIPKLLPGALDDLKENKDNFEERCLASE